VSGWRRSSPASTSATGQRRIASFASVQQTHRDSALALSYTSAGRPIVSLDELSALECALIGATAPTKAIIASQDKNLRALSDDDLAAAVETIRAFSDADPQPWSPALRLRERMATSR
jgi:hypothetical protein